MLHNDVIIIVLFALSLFFVSNVGTKKMQKTERKKKIREKFEMTTTAKRTARTRTRTMAVVAMMMVMMGTFAVSAASSEGGGGGK